MERLSYQIIKILKQSGVKTLFTIPGSLLELLKDFSSDKDIDIYTATHEEQLGYMAIGYYHSSGKIPMIMVTQGPGVTNLVTPLSCAWRDSVPLLVLTSYDRNSDIQDFQDSSGRYSSSNVSEILRPITLNQIKFHPDSLSNSLNSLYEILNHNNLDKPVFVEIENKLLKEQIDFKIKTTNKINNDIMWEELIGNIRIDENCVFLIGYGAKNMDVESLLGFIQTRRCKIATSIKGTELVPSNTAGLLGNIGYLGKSCANDFLASICTIIISIGASLNKLTLYKWYSKFEERGGTIFNIGNINYPIAQNIICDLSQISLNNYNLIESNFPIIKNPVFKYLQSQTENITYTIESFRESFFNEFIIRKGDKIITTSSHAPLGCSISLAIGSSLYNNKQIHVVICGDGGFLFTGMNILLLQKYILPIFTIVIVNNEFKTVATAQRKKWGKTICTDLILPNFDYMHSFFKIESAVCKNNDEINHSFAKFMENKKPFFVFADDGII